MQVDIDKAQERMLELFALSPELEEQFYAGNESFCSTIEDYCLDDSNAISVEAIQNLTQGTAWAKLDNPDTEIDLMPLTEVYSCATGATCSLDIKHNIELIDYTPERVLSTVLNAEFDMPISLNAFK